MRLPLEMPGRPTLAAAWALIRKPDPQRSSKKKTGVLPVPKKRKKRKERKKGGGGFGWSVSCYKLLGYGGWLCTDCQGWEELNLLPTPVFVLVEDQFYVLKATVDYYEIDRCSRLQQSASEKEREKKTIPD